MVDWLPWPADLLMSAGGIVAGWFAGKNTPTFLSLQIGFTIALAAIVSLFAFLPILVGNQLALTRRPEYRK
jgi:hypothetical protein